MTQYFAVAAGGSWSVAGTWSNSSGGASNGLVPTSAIDCVLNASSGAVTIDGTSGSPNLCRSLTCTGYTNTLTHAAAKQLNIGDASGGALLLVAGMTYSPATTSVLKFVSTTTGNNITTSGKRMGPLTFDGVGGGWQLQDALDSVAAVTGVTLVNGALDLNSKNVGATSSTGFLRSGTGTASLTMGSMTWAVSTAAGTGWDASSSSGFTLSAASSTITLNGTAANATFNGGGLTYGTVSGTTISTGTYTITGSNTFGTLTLSMGATTKNTTSGYSISGTQTVTGTFTANGNSTILRNFIYSTTLGTATTINAATVTVTHTDFRDITGAGAGSWNFSGLTTTANGDAGGNSGITFTAPKNCFMKTALSANWSAPNWFTLSGGSTAIVPAMPLVHDNCKFDINSVTTGSKTISIDPPRVPGMDWTGVANSPTLAYVPSWTGEFYGSIKFVSGMTHSMANVVLWILSGRGRYTLDCGGLDFGATGKMDCATGTWTLAGHNLGGFTSYTVTSGNLALGGFNFTGSTGLTVNGGTVSGTGAITATSYTQAGGTVTLGGTMTLSAAFALSGGTFNNNNFGVTGHTTFALSGTGTLNLSGQFNGSSTITVSAGTVNDSGASGELKGTTASFTGGTSVVRKMTLSSTFAMSSTADLTIPAGGSATWATSWTVTGTTCSLKYGGQPTFSSGALNVAGGYIPSLEAL